MTKPVFVPEQFQVNRQPPSTLFFVLLMLPGFLALFVITSLLNSYFDLRGIAGNLVFFATFFVVMGGLQYLLAAHCQLDGMAKGLWIKVTKPGLQMPRAETFIEWSALSNFEKRSHRRRISVVMRFMDGKKFYFYGGDAEPLATFLQAHFPEKEKRSASWAWKQ